MRRVVASCGVWRSLFSCVASVAPSPPSLSCSLPPSFPNPSRIPELPYSRAPLLPCPLRYRQSQSNEPASRSLRRKNSSQRRSFNEQESQRMHERQHQREDRSNAGSSAGRGSGSGAGRGGRGGRGGGVVKRGWTPPPAAANGGRGGRGGRGTLRSKSMSAAPRSAKSMSAAPPKSDFLKRQEVSPTDQPLYNPN